MTQDLSGFQEKQRGFSLQKTEIRVDSRKTRLLIHANEHEDMIKKFLTEFTKLTENTFRIYSLPVQF